MEREDIFKPSEGRANDNPKRELAGSRAEIDGENEYSGEYSVRQDVDSNDMAGEQVFERSQTGIIDEENTPSDTFETEIDGQPETAPDWEPPAEDETGMETAARDIAGEDSAANIAAAKPKSYQKLFFGIVFSAFIADQITKAIAVYFLGYLHGDYTVFTFFAEYFSTVREFPWRIGTEIYKPPVDVFGEILQWRLTTNTGAAFSMFRGNPEALAVVSAVLITVLYILYRKWGKRSLVLSIAFGMQIGGALGNFADRARLGEVVDFIATKVPGIENGVPAWVDFPIFNVADACAVVGTAIIGLVLIVRDVAYTKGHRKSHFELQRHKSYLAAMQSAIHPLMHSEYSARVEYLPVVAEPEEPDSAGSAGESNGEEVYIECPGGIVEPSTGLFEESADE